MNEQKQIKYTRSDDLGITVWYQHSTLFFIAKGYDDQYYFTGDGMLGDLFIDEGRFATLDEVLERSKQIIAEFTKVLFDFAVEGDEEVKR